MGEDSGGLEPFGIGREHSFLRLVERAADSFSPDPTGGGRFVEVAFETDYSGESVYSYYLDLTRSDGVDAPLVRFEESSELAPEFLWDTNSTFGEMMSNRIFDWFEFDRLPVICQAYIFPPVAGGVTNVLRHEIARSIFLLRHAVDGLVANGFHEALPTLSGAACLRGTQASISINLTGTGGLDLRVAGLDVSDVRPVAERVIADLCRPDGLDPHSVDIETKRRKMRG